MGYAQPGIDIFVSYACENNVPVITGQPGWVTALVQGVKKLLPMKLKRKESFDLWMDLKLQGNVPLTPEIEGKVKQAAILLMVLSNSYLKSEWCRKELDLFLSKDVGQDGRR